jgi:hypothetical protein
VGRYLNIWEHRNRMFSGVINLCFSYLWARKRGNFWSFLRINLLVLWNIRLGTGFWIIKVERYFLNINKFVVFLGHESGKRCFLNFKKFLC